MNNPIILEMLLNTRPVVMLNGQKPEREWGFEMEGNELVLSLEEGRDLVIGEHRVFSIEVNEYEGDGDSYYIFENEIVPEEIEMHTSAGFFRGKVTRVCLKNDFYYGVNKKYVTIKLYNGEDYKLDDITLYLKAELFEISEKVE
jgi:hypothetical protein